MGFRPVGRSTITFKQNHFFNPYFFIQVMPKIEDLQKMKADLDAQIAQALALEVRLQKEREIARTKQREAEIAKGLKEIASLMRQYRLSKEHLFKAAKSAPLQPIVGSENADLLNAFNPNEIRDDARFEFERAAASKEPARRMSVEEMRQFYEKFDAAEPKSA